MGAWVFLILIEQSEGVENGGKDFEADIIFPRVEECVLDDLFVEFGLRWGLGFAVAGWPHRRCIRIK